jgi:hypothetical protein
MLTGRQLNCLRGSDCLSQFRIRFGEKAKCDIASSKDVLAARQVSIGALGVVGNATVDL